MRLSGIGRFVITGILFPVAGVLLLLRSPTSAGAQECTVMCVTAPPEFNCGENTHVAAPDYDLDEADGGSHTSCWAKVCCWDNPAGDCKHPCCESCQTEEEDDGQEDAVATFEMLVDAVDGGDWDTVRSLLDADPQRFVINEARQSIQVTSSCRPEAMLANLPVSGEQIMLLMEPDPTSADSSLRTTITAVVGAIRGLLLSVLS